MNYNDWKLRWPQAAAELEAMLVEDAPPVISGKSEAAVQTALRIAASRLGWRLWRNNVGAVWSEDGTYIRYGLANDSRQLNEKLKSSDLIGIRPVIVTPDMVGSKLGIFVAREVKHAGWKYTGNGREVAQGNFINLVNSMGGDAKFYSGGEIC